MKNKIIIGIAHHKNGEFYKFSPYLPIQVGAVQKNDLGIQKDSDGDNISSQNPYCSEMSAVYWLWKNTIADYKGLFHYRRFLNLERDSSLKRLPQKGVYYITKFLSMFIRDLNYSYSAFPIRQIQEKEVGHYLERFASFIDSDIAENAVDCYALGYIKNSNRKMKSILMESIGLWHYTRALQILKDTCPAFYPYFEKTLYSNKFCSCNIIIAKSDIYDEYCNIMFSFLQKYHEYMNDGLRQNAINNAMNRDSGYIAELITDAYISMIKEKGLKIKHLGQVTVETDQTSESQHFSSFIEKVRKALK